MGETGTSRSLGNLDPSAQEFKPRNQMTFFAPTQIYSPYTLPYPSPELQLMPFSDGGVGYLQLPYVTPAVGSQPVSPVSTTPTRTLLLSSVPADVSEETVRRELEAFGGVRSVQMERAGDGIVAVSFYDLRHAQACLTELRKQHMQQQSRLRKHFINSMLAQNLGSPAENLPAPVPPPARGLIAGRATWAQFMIPATSNAPDGHNQGTLVIFNLDSRVSTNNLREIFETFGPIKELRGTPFKRHQRFVEFFDIRDAASALQEMNGKQIHGKRLVIEFSRPGGHGRRFFAGMDTITPSSTSSTAAPRFPLAASREPSNKSSSFNVSPRSHLSQTHYPTKKSSVGLNKRSSNSGAVEASMASLCLTGSVVCGIENSDGVPRWNPKKSPNSSSTATAKQKQQEDQRYGPWKGRHKKLDSYLLIDEDAVTDSHSGDSRTTVMIKNIPNKYSQQLLMNMLDNHCSHCNEQILAGENQPLSSYDFLYLPIDFNNKCNLGYGFVNMTSPQATWRLYKAFHLKSWEIFSSAKICQVTYARIQGLEALKEHFKNSKFLCETKAYLPVMFSPPRDGRLLTKPRPVVADYMLIGDDSRASDDDDGDEEEMTSEGTHRLNSGDYVCGNDDDDGVEDFVGRDQSPNDGNSG